jgi:hypothetical protein
MNKSLIRTGSLVLTLALVMPIVQSGAVRAEGTRQQFTLQDFDWLTGYWIGDGFGGTCEEMWSKPTAESFYGAFKLSVDGAVQFYEIFTMTIDSTGSPALRIKHFNADLTGWEEKDKVVTFPYESSTDTTVTLGAVTYRRLSADSLQVDVRIKDKSGNTNIESLTLSRSGK